MDVETYLKFKSRSGLECIQSYPRVSLIAQKVKNPPTIRETWV